MRKKVNIFMNRKDVNKNENVQKQNIGLNHTYVIENIHSDIINDYINNTPAETVLERKNVNEKQIAYKGRHNVILLDIEKKRGVNVKMIGENLEKGFKIDKLRFLDNTIYIMLIKKNGKDEIKKAINLNEILMYNKRLDTFILK